MSSHRWSLKIRKNFTRSPLTTDLHFSAAVWYFCWAPGTSLRNHESDWLSTSASFNIVIIAMFLYFVVYVSRMYPEKNIRLLMCICRVEPVAVMRQIAAFYHKKTTTGLRPYVPFFTFFVTTWWARATPLISDVRNRAVYHLSLAPYTIRLTCTWDKHLTGLMQNILGPSWGSK